MLFNNIKFWWFWHVIKPHKTECFKFKGYTFVSRHSKSGNFCIRIYTKSQYSFPIAELVVHNGRLDLTAFTYIPYKARLIYVMYDMTYGRNNFLQDTDAYEILSKIVIRLNYWRKGSSSGTIKETDYREALDALEKLKRNTIKYFAI